jgi:hypothetical protein
MWLFEAERVGDPHDEFAHRLWRRQRRSWQSERRNSLMSVNSGSGSGGPWLEL